MPKGTRYLDIRRSTLGLIKIRKETAAFFSKMGCPADSGIDNAFLLEKEKKFYIQYRFAIDHPACNKILMTALGALDVSSINHVWFSALDFQECLHGRGGALVLIGSGNITAENITVISSKNLKKPAEQLLRDEHDLIQIYSWFDAIRYFSDEKNHPDEVRSFMANHVFGCGGVKSEEKLLEINEFSPSEADVNKASAHVDALFKR